MATVEIRTSPKSWGAQPPPSVPCPPRHRGTRRSCSSRTLRLRKDHDDADCGGPPIHRRRVPCSYRGAEASRRWNRAPAMSPCVFQSYGLYPQMTVYGEHSLSRCARDGCPDPEMTGKVRHCGRVWSNWKPTLTGRPARAFGRSAGQRVALAPRHRPFPTKVFRIGLSRFEPRRDVCAVTMRTQIKALHERLPRRPPSMSPMISSKAMTFGRSRPWS